MVTLNRLLTHELIFVFPEEEKNDFVTTLLNMSNKRDCSLRAHKLPSNISTVATDMYKPWKKDGQKNIKSTIQNINNSLI